MGGFSSEWDSQYQNAQAMSVWPWSDVVTLVNRYTQNKGKGLRVLELGCGAGANIPFFLKIGADYWSVEGSGFIVDKIKKRFPEIEKQIVKGDFTKEIPFKETFDVILDRGSLICNSSQSISNCLSLALPLLKKGGKFIGVGWPSTRMKEFQKGVQGKDAYTRRDFKTGPFANLGNIHFFDRPNIEKLLKDFELEFLEEVSKNQLVSPDTLTDHISWNLVAIKV